MRIHDISLTLHNRMPVWPGDDAPAFSRYSSLDAGDIVNSTAIRSSAHIGTHVDAPRHLYDAGRTIDQIPLETLIGPVSVLEIPDGKSAIDRQALQAIEWPESPRILFKTKNSELWAVADHVFNREFVSLTPDGAEFLLEKNIHLVGIDYLSIDLYEAGSLPVHKILLAQDVVVIEGLNLTNIPGGSYELICLPVKIGGSDGAPARAVLLER